MDTLRSGRSQTRPLLWSRDHDRGFSAHDFVALRVRNSTPSRAKFSRSGMAPAGSSLTGKLAVRPRKRPHIYIKERACAR
jgi:hypothetical protein